MSTTDLHRCTACGAKHRRPKAYRALVVLAQSVAITVVQVLAALALDGWLAWALWAVVARNVIFTTLLVSGLAIEAADAPEQHR